MTRDKVGSFQLQYSNSLRKYVIPVYQAIDKIDKVPDLVGTAIILENDKNYYLVSAAHVLDLHKEDNPLFICKKDRDIWQFIGRRASSPVPKNGDRFDDPIDLACLEIPQQVVKEIENFTPLLIDRLTHPYMLDKNSMLLALGYPNSDTNACHQTKVITSKLFTYMNSYQADEKPDPYDRDYHILMTFNQNVVFDIDGTNDIVEVPYGTSGGPVFIIKQGDNLPRPGTEKLVGITLEVNTKKKFWVAIRADIIPALINGLLKSPLI